MVVIEERPDGGYGRAGAVYGIPNAYGRRGVRAEPFRECPIRGGATQVLPGCRPIARRT